METVISHKVLSQAQVPPRSLRVPFGMANVQFHAMGTIVSLLLPIEHQQKGTEIVQNLFAHWERTLSRFLPESELSQLNRHAGGPVIVGPLLFSVLETAIEAASTTDGLYDPTLLKQLVQNGYAQSFDEMPKEQETSDQKAHVGGGWRAIHMDATLRLVILPSNTRVEFGGIAKGMAVDAALEELCKAGMRPALVNAGGDLAVLDAPMDEGQWPIAVQGKTCVWTIPITRGCMATSGIGRRHWRQGTLVRHHLIDPRTGVPARSELWSVSVVAEKCMQAEVAAKAAFLLGIEQGSEFLRRFDLAGLFVREDGTWQTVGDWPQEQMLAEERQEEQS